MSKLSANQIHGNLRRLSKDLIRYRRLGIWCMYRQALVETDRLLNQLDEIKAEAHREGLEKEERGCGAFSRKAEVRVVCGNLGYEATEAPARPMDTGA